VAVARVMLGGLLGVPVGDVTVAPHDEPESRKCDYADNAEHDGWEREFNVGGGLSRKDRQE
jgi:hypothetical protein